MLFLMPGNSVSFDSTALLISIGKTTDRVDKKIMIVLIFCQIQERFFLSGLRVLNALLVQRLHFLLPRHDDLRILDNDEETDDGETKARDCSSGVVRCDLKNRKNRDASMKKLSLFSTQPLISVM